jgi:elongation factor 3
MAPSIAAEPAAQAGASAVKAENQKSLQIIEELVSKLSISKSQDEINTSALNLATFINGDIEEADAPTK